MHFLQNDVQLKRMQIVAHNMLEFPSASYISRSIVVELADDNIIGNYPLHTICAARLCACLIMLITSTSAFKEYLGRA